MTSRLSPRVTRRAFAILGAALPAAASSARAAGLPDCRAQVQAGSVSGSVFIKGYYAPERAFDLESLLLSPNQILQRSTINASGRPLIDVAIRPPIVIGNARGASAISFLYSAQYRNEAALPGKVQARFLLLDSARSVLGNEAKAIESKSTELFDGSITIQGEQAARLLMSGGALTLVIDVLDQQARATFSNRDLVAAGARLPTLIAGLERDFLAKSCAATSGQPCFLTTMACQEIGLADDCWELTSMRRLRDRWLVHQPFARQALADYRGLAGRVDRGVPGRLRARVFRRFYAWRVLPGAVAVRLGLYRLAYRWLYAGVASLDRRYSAAGPSSER